MCVAVGSSTPSRSRSSVMPLRQVLASALLVACARRVPADTERPLSPLMAQQARAEAEGPDQTLELVRLASLALAEGRGDVADAALRRAVTRMQDFRAEGQFRAIVGAERSKEWKGEPYEKMMAFQYLGLLLFQEGEFGNALAMAKSAVLADTGTTLERTRSDFVPAFVLQALCFDALGEPRNAERAMQQAIDALWMRALTDHLSGILEEVERTEQDPAGVTAARLLLLAGIPPGLTEHPRDPSRAIEAALSYASDLRRLALDGGRRDWPESLTGLRRGDLRSAFDALEPLARQWQRALREVPSDIVGALRDDEAFLLGLLDDPGLVLWVETGFGPHKSAEGDYGEILRLRPRTRGEMPSVTLDGRPIRPHYLDSVTFQAQTRGGRRVDGFLKGKAVFKDSSFALGWALLHAGDLANALAEDDTPLAPVLYVAGAATWIAGALTNPRADTRQWEHLPDALWLVRADPRPGDHHLAVDGRAYRVQIPDHGRVTTLLPRLEPGGPPTFGAPCHDACPSSDPAPGAPVPAPVPERPLALPLGVQP